MDIVESTIESIQNKNTKILGLFGTYIIVIIAIIFNLVTKLIKQFKLITACYFLYDTFNYHIFHYSRFIIVHHITTVLNINLTSNNMNNSCALL